MKLYTSKIVAQWLGLTERRVRQLRDEGVIEEYRAGLYDLQPTVLRYIKYLGGTGKESLQTERMKLTAEKRKSAEMDNELRRGELHRAEDIETGIKTLCFNIRSRFLAMPAKLSPELAAAGRKQSKIFDILKTAIDEALEELSDYKVALAVKDEWDDEEKDGKDSDGNG
jgi:phage terminase Nu1 subunit (DNA packaging protein)